jgi:hypothetical protein
VAFPAASLNLLLAFEPRIVMAAMQTSMIRGGITAYSTAVGPSLRFSEVTNHLANEGIGVSNRVMVQEWIRGCWADKNDVDGRGLSMLT